MPCDKWSEDRKFLPIPARNQIARFSDYCPLTLTEVAYLASVPVRKKSSQTIFRKRATRKLGWEIESVPSVSRPNFCAACLRKIVWELFFRTGTLATQAITEVKLSSNKVAVPNGKLGNMHFFDVRVLNPFVKSHLNQRLETVFTSNKRRKSDTIISTSLSLSMAPSASPCLHPVAEIEGKLSAALLNWCTKSLRRNAWAGSPNSLSTY